LTAPIALRSVVRRLDLRPAADATWRGALGRMVAPLAGLFGCGLAASIAFFLGTNFAHWVAYDMYEHTLGGLAQCYLQALPFFRYTLAGDMLFALVFFGGYAVALQWRHAARTEAAANIA
jgi:hypothetical protein